MNKNKQKLHSMQTKTQGHVLLGDRHTRDRDRFSRRNNIQEVTFFFLEGTPRRQTHCCELTQETKDTFYQGRHSRNRDRFSWVMTAQNKDRFCQRWHSGTWIGATESFVACDTWKICSVRVILGYILLGVTPRNMVCRGWYTGTHSVGGDIQEKG